jgi:rRNA maturation endonuclease Nob1
MAVLQPRAGDVVRASVSWPGSARNKCAVCTKYMPFGDHVRCPSCGTEYELVTEGFYLIKDAA